MDKFLIIKLKATTTAPLYSGEVKQTFIEQARGVNLPIRRTGDGRVAIPIYGALRAYLEKILREKGEEVCDTGAKGAKGCGRCVLCDLFGHLGKRGRAIIDDIVSEERADKIVSKATHLRLNRADGVVSDTMTLEEVPEGVTFTGKVRIIEPKERDSELIGTAIEAINEFGIGGWLTRGHGRVKMEFTIEERRWTQFIERAREILKKLKG